MIRPAETVSSLEKIKSFLKCVFNSQTYGTLLESFFSLFIAQFHYDQSTQLHDVRPLEFVEP